SIALSPLGACGELKGPVGERNVYTLRRRGRVAAVATSESALLVQIGGILATGNAAGPSSAPSLRRAPTRCSAPRSPHARFRDFRLNSPTGSRAPRIRWSRRLSPSP